MDYTLSLPSDLLSAILSLCSPRDVCRSSAVSTRFRAVAGSDSVWEKLLPADYKQIIAKSTSPLEELDTKKKLFFLLADSHIIIHGRSMSFALDKETGKKCYMLGARKLTISWGDTPQYWQWITSSQSRFAEVANLLFVWWLEIRGKIDTSLLSPNTTYTAYLVFRVGADRYGGIVSVPMKTSVGFIGEGKEKLELEEDYSTVYLKKDGKSRHRQVKPKEGWLPMERKDKWMEIELGEFYSDGHGGEVEMVLMEVEFGIPRSDLTVEGIEIRPKKVV